MKYSNIGLLVALLLFSVLCFGQTHAPVVTEDMLNSAPSDTSTRYQAPPAIEVESIQPPDASTHLTSYEFKLSILILSFGALIVIGEIVLAWKGIIESEHVFKSLIITLIVIASLVLIAAGYSNTQISGVLGLLGSISGYLLGKMDSGKHNSTDANKRSNE